VTRVTDRDWQLSPTRTTELAVLEHLYDAGDDWLNAFRDLDLPDSAIAAGVRAASDDGFVRVFPGSMSLADTYPAAQLTARGSAEVDRIRKLRKDTAARARAARVELLTWIYQRHTEHPPPTRILNEDPPPAFYGDWLTEQEVLEAGGYLKERGLISGEGALGTQGCPIRARLTSDGRDCVEEFDADPGRYLAAQRSPAAGPTYLQNIHAPTGPVIQGETVTATFNTGVNVEQLASALAELRKIVEAVQDNDGRDDLELTLDAVTQELTKEAPDPDTATTRVRALQRAVTRVGDKALTAAVSQGVQRLFEAAPFLVG
jgi:hypothetical protein